MVTIGISKWTTESAKEMGKRFVEMKPIPDFIQVVGPYNYPDDNEGITAITIFKYDKNNSVEANAAIANLFLIFYGIPGFRYSLKLAAGTATTLKMFGFE